MTVFDQLLALEGKTRADVPMRGTTGNILRQEGIQDDATLERVLALPRRPIPTPQEVEHLSSYLRKRPYNAEGKPNRLWVQQAGALREIYEVGGMFGPMPVGSGKTLVTLLAATLLQSLRPVLMVPASLIDKTRKDFAALYEDWHVRLPKLLSYEMLGHPDHERDLLELAPDLLIQDECHRSRNLDAACTRRINRARDVLTPVMVNMSGTLITPKIIDYHHHAVWALRERAPLPLQAAEAERWGKAVDKEVSALQRINPGALDRIPGGYHEWLRGSRGVVIAQGGTCDASIEMSVWQPKLPEQLAAVIQQTAATGIRPAATPGEEPVLLNEWELPDCLCQLALGFFYVWDPMPPEWWLRPRSGWRAYVRAVLDEQLEGFDSESQIVRALDRSQQHTITETYYPEDDDDDDDAFESISHDEAAAQTDRDRGPPLTRTVTIDALALQPPMPEEGLELLQAWRAIRDDFVPNPVPVWLDRSILQAAIKHAGKGCLIWTRYRAAGHELERLGVPYYPGGTDPESAPEGSTIAVSIAAHGTGRNLQSRSRALVLTPMANADAWEQLIGREHRAGQLADTVSISVLESIDYHGAVLERVLAEAHATTRASGFTHKLVAADWT